MVSVLEARLLLDTGPTEAEILEIQRQFKARNLTVTAEGHSYGGPPPTSAFLIILNAPVARFLDHFAAHVHEGAGRLRTLIEFLASLRSDPRRWGRPHESIIEDSTNGLTVELARDLPPSAYEALLAVDVSAFDRNSSPARLAWDPRLRRWTAAMTEAPVTVARRLPVREGAGSAEPTVAAVTGEQVRRLWQLVQASTHSVVSWQRAYVVLWSSMGWSTSSIVGRTMLSPDRVRAIITNFNRDGFAALRTSYSGGEPLSMTDEERQEAETVVRQGTKAFDLASGSTWDAESLAAVLVGRGIVEDIDARGLESLLSCQA
ncbi:MULTISPECIES: hypothetical protein [unclassified Streptomyces]|uniref:hypothetical protein n=1 Tax=unclassified Streptomyces TaxID=2593676 RepID=UPI00382CFF44